MFVYQGYISSPSLGGPTNPLCVTLLKASSVKICQIQNVVLPAAVTHCEWAAYCGPQYWREMQWHM